jgi:hypothetical protein
VVFLFVGFAIGRNHRKFGRMVEMSKVIPLPKNHKNYDGVPDGLKWALPIHECLEKAEVKEASRQLEAESKARVKIEFRKKNIKIVK